MNFAILNAMDSAKSVERMPTPNLAKVPKFIKLLFGYFIVPKMNTLAFSLADVCSKLKVCVLDVQRNTDEELIDPDLVQRKSLDEMKEFLLRDRASLRDSYRDIDPMGTEMPKLHNAVTSVVSLMGELYEIATELQWALAEHDASYSKRLDGFAAANPGELEAMLQRITTPA